LKYKLKCAKASLSVSRALKDVIERLLAKRTLGDAWGGGAKETVFERTTTAWSKTKLVLGKKQITIVLLSHYRFESFFVKKNIPIPEDPVFSTRYYLCFFIFFSMVIPGINSSQKNLKNCLRLKNVDLVSGNRFFLQFLEIYIYALIFLI
jgi:hypothetical protein